MAGTPSDLTMSDVKRWTTNWHNFKVSYVAEKATGDIIWQPTGKTYREMPYIDWSYINSNNSQTFMGTGTISISVPTTNVTKYEITFSIPDISKYMAGTAYHYPIIGGYNSTAGSNNRNNVYVCLRYSSTTWRMHYYKSNSPASTTTGNILYNGFTPNTIYKLQIVKNGSYAYLYLYNSSNTLLASMTTDSRLYMPAEFLIIGGAPNATTGYPVIYSINSIYPAKSVAVYSIKTYDSNDTLIANGVAMEHKTDYTIDFVNTVNVGTWLVKNNATTQYMNLPQYTGTSVENPSWSGDIRMHANVSDL